MKYTILLLCAILLYACWKPYRTDYAMEQAQQKVWGSKPIYTAESVAKKISYLPQKHPLIQAGNIYAFGNYIFQVDVGRGIHVINNSNPSTADRIGFITITGCQQISIKGKYLYTNSFADLVTLDISDPSNMLEVSRVIFAFPELAGTYPLVQPTDTGYYICPRMDSIVVGWVKDSIYTSCYKN